MPSRVKAPLGCDMGRTRTRGGAPGGAGEPSPACCLGECSDAAAVAAEAVGGALTVEAVEAVMA